MKTIVANWKTYFSFNETRAWLDQHAEDLRSLQSYANVIICPSFDALSITREYLEGTNIQLGGQDCSPSSSTPMTGQVLAQSLVDLNCSYCIVGHSETMKQYAYDYAIIGQKITCLVAHSITPIICCGEDQSSALQHQLTEQLDFLIPLIIQFCYIAYEPKWAIGTGATAPLDHIEQALSLIESICTRKGFHAYKVLYGGSINETTIRELQHSAVLQKLDGFLIGKASTDFQKLKKIVLSLI